MKQTPPPKTETFNRLYITRSALKYVSYQYTVRACHLQMRPHLSELVGKLTALVSDQFALPWRTLWLALADGPQ